MEQFHYDGLVNDIEAGDANGIRRVSIDLALTSERRVRAVEYMPGDRRVVRAAFFSIQETGQWIGSWTPWYGFVELPPASSYRLPAGSHIVAEIHYRGVKERVVEQGTLGLFLADKPTPNTISDVVLETKTPVAENRFRAETRLTGDVYAVALRPEISPTAKSLEVSVRNPDGSTEVLLFAKDIPVDWPTPYIFKNPVLLRRGALLSVTAYSGGVKLTVSTAPRAAGQ